MTVFFVICIIAVLTLIGINQRTATGKRRRQSSSVNQSDKSRTTRWQTSPRLKAKHTNKPRTASEREMSALSYAFQSSVMLDIRPSTKLMLDKLTELANPDEANCVEVLLLLECLQGKVTAKHLHRLKAVFARYGSNNHLFDVALFNVVAASHDCREKFELLEFIYQNSRFTRDFTGENMHNLKAKSQPSRLFANAF